MMILFTNNTLQINKTCITSHLFYWVSVCGGGGGGLSSLVGIQSGFLQMVNVLQFKHLSHNMEAQSPQWQ